MTDKTQPAARSEGFLRRLVNEYRFTRRLLIRTSYAPEDCGRRLTLLRREPEGPYKRKSYEKSVIPQVNSQDNRVAFDVQILRRSPLGRQASAQARGSAEVDDATGETLMRAEVLFGMLFYLVCVAGIGAAVLILMHILPEFTNYDPLIAAVVGFTGVYCGWVAHADRNDLVNRISSAVDDSGHVYRSRKPRS